MSGSPVEQILGRDAAEGGAFALLGLPPVPTDAGEIVAALERRLAEVESHTLSATPQADEVRLALHASAVQLLDRGVQRRLIRREVASSLGSGATPTRSPDRARPVGSPAHGGSSVRALPRSAAAIGLERDALLTLGAFGGWKPRALRRLVALAHARGLTADDVAETLRRLARPRSGGAASKARAVGQPAGLFDDLGPTLPRRWWVFAACAAGGLFGVSVAIVGLVRVIDAWDRGPADAAVALEPRSSPRELAHDTGDRDDSEVSRAAAAIENPIGLVPPELRDPGTLRRLLSSSALAFERDPEAALGDFETGVAALSRTWTDMPAADLRASNQAVLDLASQAMPSRSRRDRTLEILERGLAPLAAAHEGAPLLAHQVQPASWSAGLMTTLASRGGLPAQAVIQIDGRLRRALRVEAAGGSFGAGAAAGSVSMVDPIMATILADADRASRPTGRDAEWARWLASVDAALIADPSSRDAVVLDAVRVVATHAAAPRARATVRRAVDELVPVVSWRDGASSRDWLVRLFEDRSVPAAGLSIVTEAVALRSSATGVDATMVLSPTASLDTRRSLQARYASAWGLSSEVRFQSAAGRWRRAVDGLMAIGPGAPAQTLTDTALDLRVAVDAARLNAAAELIWRGRHDEAEPLLDALPPIQPSSVPPPSTPTPASTTNAITTVPPTDGVWAHAFLASERNVVRRLQLLNEIERSPDPLGPADAEAIVNAAIRGSPVEVRYRASDLVRARSTEPTIINGVLEYLPGMPATRRNLDLVAIVGGERPGTWAPRDEGWRLEARRAIVRTLLAAVARGSDLNEIDDLANDLADAYALRLRASGGVPGGDEGATATATRLRSRWSAIAGRSLRPPARGLSLTYIESRAAARSRVARGLVQAFASEQLALAETMAAAIAGENPGRTTDVLAVLERGRADWATRETSTEQVRDAELFMLELWSLRFGSSLVEDPS